MEHFITRDATIDHGIHLPLFHWDLRIRAGELHGSVLSSAAAWLLLEQNYGALRARLAGQLRTLRITSIREMLEALSPWKGPWMRRICGPLSLCIWPQPPQQRNKNKCTGTKNQSKTDESIIMCGGTRFQPAKNPNNHKAYEMHFAEATSAKEHVYFIIIR